MSSPLFDYVAYRYDATRAYPKEAEKQINLSIERAARLRQGTRTQLLEVGADTGRFALPLAEHGWQYTGVDISPKMLEVFKSKLLQAGWEKATFAWGSLLGENVASNPEVHRFSHYEKHMSMNLVIADVTALPFHDDSFNVVLAVHVFHLIPNWQTALEEILRVLRPGGVLVRCRAANWEDTWQPGLGDIRKRWTQIVQELGVKSAHPGASDQAVTDWIQQRGLKTEQIGVVEYEQKLTPRDIFTSVEQRLWTSTLVVPDDLFAASIELLRRWMDKEYGSSMDAPFTQKRQTIIEVSRLPG